MRDECAPSIAELRITHVTIEIHAEDDGFFFVVVSSHSDGWGKLFHAKGMGGFLENSIVKALFVDQSDTYPQWIGTFIAASRRAEVDISKLSLLLPSLTGESGNQSRQPGGGFPFGGFSDRGDWQDFDRCWSLTQLQP